MSLVLDATYRNKTSADGEDHLGRIFLDCVAARVASGQWRRKYQGDGLAAFSSGTSNIFTANGGLGYATGGAWNTAVGVANSMTNAKAYVVVEEVVSGSATGRQELYQRGSGVSAGNDRNVVVIFAWTAFTGSPNATTAPTAPTLSQSFAAAAVNGAGANIFTHATTSPQMGGSGGAISYNVWIADAVGGMDCEGTAKNVYPYWLEVYRSTGTDEPLFALGYEALTDAAVADAHPCVVSHPIASGSSWEFGEVRNIQPPTHGALSSTATFWAVSPIDNASIINCAIERIVPPDGFVRPGTGTGEMVANIDAKHPVFPSRIWADATNSTWKGVLETVETFHVLDAYLWPATFDTSVAAYEPPRISQGHTLLPWELGVSRTGLAGSEFADVLYRVHPTAPAPDETAPTIGAFSPAAGAIGYTQAITVPISDNIDELSHFEIWAEFASQPDERVWSGSDFSSDYSTSSGLSGGNVIVRRDAGWPAAFTLKAKAWDQDNNASSVGSAAYTISTSPNPAGVDVTAPVIGSFSPAAGAITYTQAITVPISDNVGVSAFFVTAQFAGQPDETIWDGSSYSSDYSTSSGLSGGSFIVRRDAGWPGAFTLRVHLRDAASNTATSTAAYTISTSPNPAAADAVAPTIGSFSPASASAISVTQVITFAVADDRSLGDYVVVAEFADQPDETIWNGNTLSSDYDAASSLPGSGTVSIARDAGWPGPFTLRVRAKDATANVANATATYTMAVTHTPAVSSVSPVSGSAIAIGAAVSFRVTDPTGLQVQDIWAEYPDGTKEQIWDGAEFSAAFVANSSRSVISANKTFDFVIDRALAWYDDPVITIRMADLDGHVASQTLSYTLTSEPGPSLGSVSPAEDSEIEIGDSVSFSVVGTSAPLQLVTITAEYGEFGFDVVHTGTAFTPEYTGGSRSGITNGYAFVLAKTDGWTGDVDFHITAVDTDGRVLEETISYTVSGAEAGGAPTVGPFTPTAGTPITADQAIAFPVVDNSAQFALIVITAFFARTGAWEVVWLKNQFAPWYSGSSRAPIEGGHTYTVRRSFDGWVDGGPTLIVEVVDASGVTNT